MLSRHFCTALVRSGRIICAAITVAASLALNGNDADARDRPGTPNDVYASACTNDITHAKRVCAYFTNTAHEDVRIEWQSTRNGAPASLNAEYCAPDAKKLTRIQCFTAAAGTIHANSTTNGPFGEFKQYGANVTYGLMTADVDFGATYCMRFRARRVSDQVVSEVWSAWACTTTPPTPPKPGQPRFAVTYHGSQTIPHPADAGGQAAQPVPETMQIAPVTESSVAEYDLKVSAVGSSTSAFTDVRKNSSGLAPFVYKIDPGMQAVSVQLCAVNFSGTTCASQLQSISGEGSIGIPARTAVVHVLPSPRPELPIRLTGKPVQPASQELMIGSDLPGSDYQHEPISGVAQDCEKRCDVDGNCLAWTWVKPGVQNSQAMCWLKNAVPPSVKNENTISGIKRGSTIVR